MSKTYTVQKGDTLFKIAKAFGVSIGDIVAHNPAKLSNPDKIQVGWELVIPYQNDSETSESFGGDYESIGMCFVECIDDIKCLASYKKLCEALEKKGD